MLAAVCYSRTMINIVLIEDEKAARDTLHNLLEEYEKERGQSFAISSYVSADEFLAEYHGNCDILFADIEMPGTDGMTAMEQVRRRDPDVIIIFVTGIARLAAQSYSVGALDYILKPAERVPLFAAMDNAMRIMGRRRRVRICVNTSDGEVYLDSAEITYIEVFGHFLVYHTGGEDVTEWATLGKPERQLSSYGFVRCSKSYLVNLKYVEGVDGDEVIVAGDRLKIGRTRYKAFMSALNEYLGG